MKKLTILVDMDDTIENLLETWVYFLNDRYGTNVQISDIHDWNLCKAFGMLTHDEVYNPLIEDALWERVKPLPGAQKYLKKIIDDGHDVFIVTATDYRNIKRKIDSVLIPYFPFISPANVIVAHKKHLIKGDVLIDDGPHNFEFWDRFGILMTAQHNLEYDAPAHGLPRVYTWEEAYAAICEIQKLNEKGALRWK